MRKFWEIEFPVGDANRGTPFAERTDPATIAVVSAVGAGLGGAGTLFSALGSKKSSPIPPPMEKPVTMPTPDDEATRAARRRSLAASSQRGGRQSTILSDPLSGGDLLGG